MGANKNRMMKKQDKGRKAKKHWDIRAVGCCRRNERGREERTDEEREEK